MRQNKMCQEWKYESDRYGCPHCGSNKRLFWSDHLESDYCGNCDNTFKRETKMMLFKGIDY